jgi:hypothetical protein
MHHTKSRNSLSPLILFRLLLVKEVSHSGLYFNIRLRPFSDTYRVQTENTESAQAIPDVRRRLYIFYLQIFGC